MMDIEEPTIPLDLLKQDPTTGNYKLGSIEMTPAEYVIASAVNDMNLEIIMLKERLTKVEGK